MSARFSTGMARAATESLLAPPRDLPCVGSPPLCEAATGPICLCSDGLRLRAAGAAPTGGASSGIGSTIVVASPIGALSSLTASDSLPLSLISANAVGMDVFVDDDADDAIATYAGGLGNRWCSGGTGYQASALDALTADNLFKGFVWANLGLLPLRAFSSARC